MSFHLVILILHVFGAGLVIGVVLLSVFVVIRPPLTAQGADRLGFIGKFGMLASIWQFLTGFILASQDWGEFRGSRTFWVKMACYAAEGTIAALLIEKQAKRVKAQIAAGQAPDSNRLRTPMVIQAVLILAIAALGVVLVSGGNE